MKYKCKISLILIFAVVLLSYNVDSLVAMAAEQNTESLTEVEAGQPAEPAAEAEPEQPAEPAAEAEPEQPTEPAAEAEPEQPAEPVAEAEPEQPAEPVAEAKPEQPAEPAAEAGLEQSTEPAAEAEAGQNIDSNAAPVNLEQNITANLLSEPAPELVSTGEALTEWLESHKNTGGTVKLADHVVLDEYYSYCPNGIDMPAVLVDTGRYTITVTGEVDLLSDGNLTFSGQPDGKGIFYVARKGVLSMQGIAVESGQCALWQEEGAGLVVADCRISGSIHYADIPFVMDQDSVCVVVEKGQTLSDVLPAQISCSVNRQGSLSHNEQVPLIWDLEGYDKQQEERRRFRMQGSFLHVASAEPAVCTVVYHDYPLTFMDVQASVCENMYMFRGYYTTQEGLPSAQIISEYSFDGENWFMYEETSTSTSYDGFFIAVNAEQYDMAAHSNIYIRLQWNDSGNRYFSNVLCYAAGDLGHVEDIGGSRGGATAITNPPDNPQKSITDTSAESKEQNQNVNHNTNLDSAGTETAANDGQASNPDTGQPSHSDVPDTDAGQTSYSDSQDTNEDNEDQPLYSDSQDTDENQPLYSALQDTDEDQPVYEGSKIENNAINTDNPDSKESVNHDDYAVDGKKEETAVTSSAYGENNTNPLAINEQMLNAGIRESNTIIIVAGFVLLSAAAGIVGFCFHFRSGTKR